MASATKPNTVKLGSGEFTYEVDANWATLPPGYTLGAVPTMAVDSKDNIYACNRNHGVTAFDNEGNFLRSWGEDVFTAPHGACSDADDNLYVADMGDHTIRKCTPDGKVLMTLGVPGKPAGQFSEKPFNTPTNVIVDPKTGDIYVADGYGNGRVHKYSPDGKLLLSWGKTGTDPGEFAFPHNIDIDKDGYVYVADRENNRIQIFDSNGKLQNIWNMKLPFGVYITDEQDIYVTQGIGAPWERKIPNFPPWISVLNMKGETLARIGNGVGGQGFGTEPGQFVAPHDICVNSKGTIYVSEVGIWCWENHVFLDYGEEPAGDPPSFHTLVKAS